MKVLLYLIILCLTACGMPHNQCAGVKAKIGMSSGELEKICGKPNRINYSLGRSYNKEQWIYSSMAPPDYVYIEEGRVTSMQW